MISGGLTIYLLPQDVIINKSFKDELKKEYTRYCTDQKDTSARAAQEDLINWVWEIWNYDKMYSEMVIKSLKTEGITLIQNGSEFKILIDHIPLLLFFCVFPHKIQAQAGLG